MAKYYNDCGWLPFGWSKTEAENVGKCGPSTELKDGKCQLIPDTTTVLLTTFEYCRQNNYLSGDHPLCMTSNEVLSRLDKCTEGFLTDDCRTQVETANSLAGLD